MNEQIKFTPLDLRTWKCGQMFYYFSKMAPTGYSLTVELDITKMITALKAADIKFFPAYLWLVTKNLNLQTEFKIAEQDGQIGFYDTLTPLYATFHDDDKTFSLMWTEYNQDFKVFYQSYLDNQKRYGDNHGVLSQNGTVPPANAYTVSCIPWVSFQHFCVHSYLATLFFFFIIYIGNNKNMGHLFKSDFYVPMKSYQLASDRIFHLLISFLSRDCKHAHQLSYPTNFVPFSRYRNSFVLTMPSCNPKPYLKDMDPHKDFSDSPSTQISVSFHIHHNSQNAYNSLHEIRYQDSNLRKLSFLYYIQQI